MLETSALGVNAPGFKNEFFSLKPPKTSEDPVFSKTRKQSFEKGGWESKLQSAWEEVAVDCTVFLSSRGRYNLSPNYLLKFAVWLFALTLLCLAITTAKVIIHLNVKITYAL